MSTGCLANGENHGHIATPILMHLISNKAIDESPTKPHAVSILLLTL